MRPIPPATATPQATRAATPATPISTAIISPAVTGPSASKRRWKARNDSGVLMRRAEDHRETPHEPEQHSDAERASGLVVSTARAIIR